ncbi:MAG TPA: hypothetical protein VHZ03_36120 [Trebonia sp.]|jgi:hypothetical protein|nr:hypothetical protein [Trebonia sp.]
MTDLETQLRRALRVSQDPGYAPPGHPVRGRDEPAFDVAGIIVRGRRLRWRRRAVAVGGSLCVAAAMFGAATGIAKLATSPVHPAQHVVGPAQPGPAPSASRPISAPSPSASPTAIATPRPSNSATPRPTGAATPSPSSTAAPGAQPTVTPIGSPTPQPYATPTPSANS